MNTYPYFNVYNPQPSVDRINEQINQLENMKKQMQQPQPTPTNLTQNFQLAPSNLSGLRYFNTLDEVDKEVVYSDTPFFSKDMSVLWLKNNKGEIRTYELKEIVPKDSKDLQIEYLQARIDKLEGMINNEQLIANANAEQVTADTTEHDDTTGTTIEKSKPSGISKISGSKKK